LIQFNDKQIRLYVDQEIGMLKNELLGRKRKRRRSEPGDLKIEAENQDEDWGEMRGAESGGFKSGAGNGFPEKLRHKKGGGA
jgi:hypothetical protein